MKTDIQGRNALVMGSSKGIGQGIAYGLAREGVNVCLVARNADKLRQTAEAIRGDTGVAVYTISADLARADDIARVYNYAQESMGSVDILINNAGGPKYGQLLDLSERDWQDTINLTLLSTVRMTTLAIPSMKEMGWGRIVTVTSATAKEPVPAMVLSCTARAGVTAFMKAIATELAPLGVTANVVAPGGVLTDRIRDLVKTKADIDNVPYEELLKQNEKSIPFGRFATPEEFAAYVVFLCSDSARYITGTCLNVDGGLSKSAF